MIGMGVRKYLLLVTLITLSVSVGYWLGEQRVKLAWHGWKPGVVVNKNSIYPTAQADLDFTLFWKVWDRLGEAYVDKNALDSKKMLDGAISGMVSALGDPYTVYLPIPANKEAKEDLGGAFEGVGIQLGFRDSRLAVVTPLEGMPAIKAGVRSGDYILHIKDIAAGVDRDTDGLSLPEAVKIIRGKRGTVVELTLHRNGDKESFKVNLTRDTIVVKSVTMELLDPSAGSGRVAWVKLTRFGDRTMSEWGEVVSRITNKEERVTGVVLDLRNNPGGYLEGAVQISGEFLSAGKLVVAQQYGDGTKQENRVGRNGALLKMPMVVIVNKGSASASEILAGALQDYKRAKIVGEKSFGKGSVQQPDDFPDGSGLHVTVAKWLRPNGEWIDKKGITPDVEVKWEPDENASDSADWKSDLQLVKAVEML